MNRWWRHWLALWAAGVVVSPVAAGEPVVRNVVLIVLDDQSAPPSGLGWPGARTPATEALAARGVVFRRAYAAAPSCAPARGALLTGLAPHTNGHWRNTITPELGEPDREFTREGKTIDRVGVHGPIETLPEILGRRGWFRAITQKFHLSPPWKFPFDARDPVDTVPAEFATAMAGFLEKSGDRPFFIMANISPPHRNFDTHLRKNPDSGPLPDERAITVPGFLPDTPRSRADLVKYAANVEIADRCAGAILAALERDGRLRDTLIVLTADQGMPYHRAKASVYPAGLHVPLVIAGPGIPGGRSVEKVVSSLDLFPTILEACGSPLPPGLQGASLYPFLRGDGPLPRRGHVFGAFHSHGPVRAEWFPQRMITDGEWYLVQNLHPGKKQELPADLRAAGAWGNDSHAATIEAATSHPLPYRLLRDLEEGRRPAVELFHLPSDPWATRDLARQPGQADRVAALLEALAAWRKETGDYQNWPDEIPTR